MSNGISNINIKRLLISHNLFSAGRVFFEIFLNIFIWKETGDLVLIAWFNIAYLLMHNISFHIFAPYVKAGKIHFPRIMALYGFVITYLIISFLKENTINYVIPIAIVIGIFNGMYWISYQVLRFDLTNSKNRGNYTGMENGLRMLVNILIPPLGGAIIVANFFGLGYSSIFFFGAILFLFSLIIGSVKFNEYKTTKFHLRKTFKLILRNKDIMKTMYSYSLSSFSRGGTIARLVLPLLIFDVMKNELLLGGWLSFFSIVAILASVFFGRYIKYKYYKNLILSGGIIYFLLVILIILFPEFWMYILFGALYNLADLFIKVPKRVISENLIHSLEDESNHRIEYIVIREWFNIGFGRVFSFVLLLFVGVLSIESMQLLLILMAIAVLGETIILRTIKREI